MGFGRNPHVIKAQPAEQKARDARDDVAYARNYRDAAHQWDRAAERETPGKLRSEYESNAVRARELADGKRPHQDAEGSDDFDPKLMN